MRYIGTVTSKNASQQFKQFLEKQGIEATVMMNQSKEWDIWVINEDHRERAESLLTQFLEDPDNPRYKPIRDRLFPFHFSPKARMRPSRARTIDVRTQVFHREAIPAMKVTYGFIAISVVISLASQLGSNLELLNALLITEVHFRAGVYQWFSTLPEIQQGEIWRIFTPMFIHFGVLHLLFNMLWLRDLGSLLEYRKGVLFLVLFTLITGGMSNVGQFFSSGPLFGGMSGVIYGMLGYAWMMTKFAPLKQIYVNKMTVNMMIIWYFLCLFNVIGHVANTAHTIGALVGIAWGFIEAKLGR